MKTTFHFSSLLVLLLLIFSCKKEMESVDVLIENGIIYDGTGTESYKGVIAINADTIYYIGTQKNFSAKTNIDAQGKAVSPGFINMLSWGYSSLMQDGRSLSDLKQGVTLEVFGEGTSPGPSGSEQNGDYQSFGAAMTTLETKGISTNIASYLGAASVRIQTIGYDDRKATEEELDQMRKLVETSME